MKRILKGLSYTFYRNIGKTDRTIRVLIALLLLLMVNLFAFHISIDIILVLLSLMILATAVLGKCSLFYMLDYKTLSLKERENLKEKNIKYEK